MPANQSVEFLIVDDEPTLSEFLIAYLEQKGHSCAALNEGFRAGAWLQTNQCEVVIVDLNMPKVDGISLISFIREIDPKLPVIVFTGFGYDEAMMHAALCAGANGYVSKNLPLEHLYCVLARVLAAARHHTRRVHTRPALLGVA